MSLIHYIAKKTSKTRLKIDGFLMRMSPRLFNLKWEYMDAITRIKYILIYLFLTAISIIAIGFLSQVGSNLADNWIK